MREEQVPEGTVVELPPELCRITRRAWHRGRWEQGAREIAEETAVALTYDGESHAVMMATPRALEDFAVGFSLTEGIVAAPDDIESLEVAPLADGIDIRLWLRGPAGAGLADRRRRMAGPLGCGMCGLSSLAEANRGIPTVGGGRRFAPDDVMAAIAALRPAQQLNACTRAVHAAAFWRPGRPLAIREDVGRHNALDKLAGALARAGTQAAEGIVVLSSRLSVEMVQKAAMIGAPFVVAVSAPTHLAIRAAEAAGLTLVGVAREDGFEVFSHGERIGG